MSNNKKPTINDIAKDAGVSKTTVSRYINGKFEHISKKTQDRINRVIKMSNYYPSTVARSLKTKKTNQIGVILSDMGVPFSSALSLGIGEYLQDNGYDPLFVDSRESIENEKNLINMLITRNVGGLIVNTSSEVNPDLIKAACDGMPVVLIDRYVSDYKFNIVTLEQNKIIEELIKYIKLRGYTRPVLFTQRWESNSTRKRRREAFISSVKKLYGYDPTDDIFVISKHLGITASEKLEEMFERIKPGEKVAIIGVNTETTVKVYKAIRDRGLSIPTDIGLCGPEDWDWQNDLNWPTLLTPSITTIYIPSIDMGRQSAKLLLDKINNKFEGSREIVLNCELRIRGSLELNR